MGLSGLGTIGDHERCDVRDCALWCVCVCSYGYGRREESNVRDTQRGGGERIAVSFKFGEFSNSSSIRMTEQMLVYVSIRA